MEHPVAADNDLAVVALPGAGSAVEGCRNTAAEPASAAAAAAARAAAGTEDTGAGAEGTGAGTAALAAADNTGDAALAGAEGIAAE